MSRRTAIAGGLAVAAWTAVLGGCTSESGSTGPPTPERPGADEVARRAAAVHELTLAAQGSALVTATAESRALRTAAGVAATAHSAHASALLAGLPSPSASATGSAVGTASAPVRLSAKAFAQAELEAAASHQTALGPLSGAVARLLASVAASDAALAATLRGAAG